MGLHWVEYDRWNNENGNDIVPVDYKAVYGFEPQFHNKREMERVFGAARME